MASVHSELAINVEILLRNQKLDLETIMQHYNVTPTMVEESKDHIKKWYEMQPHLPQGVLDDNKLLRHLAVRAFSIERAKEKIDSYYTARNVCPEFLTDRDPMSPSLQQAMAALQIAVLPQKTDENYRISIYRFINDDPTAITVVDAFKLCFMIADYRLENDLTLGEHFVVDMSNIKLGHVLQLTPSIMNKVNYYTYTCIGAKVKGMHIIGLPAYAEAMIAMIKKSLPKKIADRVNTYAKFDDLKTTFPVKILPKDMGGEEMSSTDIFSKWKETLESPGWRNWFIEQDNVKTDESKRDKTSINRAAEELAGIQGSFRKLDLD